MWKRRPPPFSKGDITTKLQKYNDEFKKSFPALGKYQPKLAQIILELREFKFFYWRTPPFFKGEIIHKIHWQIWKIDISPEPLGQFQLNLAQIIFGRGEFNFFFFGKKGFCPLPMGENYEIAKIHWQIWKIDISPEPLGQFQQCILM